MNILHNLHWFKREFEGHLNASVMECELLKTPFTIALLFYVMPRMVGGGKPGKVWNPYLFPFVAQRGVKPWCCDFQGKKLLVFDARRKQKRELKTKRGWGPSYMTCSQKGEGSSNNYDTLPWKKVFADKGWRSRIIIKFCDVIRGSPLKQEEVTLHP